MAHYAAENLISQLPIEGGVEISADQYAAALAGMIDGKLVTIIGGFAVIDPPLPEPEPEPEPQEPGMPDAVSARQFKLQLLADGLLDDVDAWVAAQGRAVQIAYEYSGTFVRAEPMMQAGFAALGFTEEQGDAFFTAAALL